MKRYIIFAGVNPILGGLLLLFATTVASGYWTETNWSEVETFFVTFARNLRQNAAVQLFVRRRAGADARGDR